MASLLLGGCGVTVNQLPAGSYIGRPGIYDYSPSVIQTGIVQQFWWCGGANNPKRPSQVSDTVQYATVNLATAQTSIPITVLAETPGTWDAAYVCNPHVVRGIFTNPLGNGATYTYAMYYVGTDRPNGSVNSIGVAFSNDGVHWSKYPAPVILPSTEVSYGVGQPVAYNVDHRSAITLFYEDANLSCPNCNHFEAASSDGVHFAVVGELTSKGLPLNMGWGDIGYDSAQDFWYATFNEFYRPSSNTAGIEEWGQEGVTLYRIPASSLFTGATPWQPLKTFDTNWTGRESNFIGGLLHDQYGNLNVDPYPVIKVFISFSNPAPAWNASLVDAARSAAISKWDIGEVEWDPASSQLPLNEYANAEVKEVTTGWVDPKGGFILKSTLGHLYQAPQNGADLALYGCKDGKKGFFISTDKTCDGKHFIGLEGYGYGSPQLSPSMVPLYSCKSGGVYSVVQQSHCGGSGEGTLLGFALR